MSALEAAVGAAWILSALILVGWVGNWIAGSRTAVRLCEAIGLPSDPDLPVRHVRTTEEAAKQTATGDA